MPRGRPWDVGVPGRRLPDEHGIVCGCGRCRWAGRRGLVAHVALEVTEGMRQPPLPRHPGGTDDRTDLDAGALVPCADRLSQNGAIVVGTPASSPIVRGLGIGADLARFGPEGYVIRNARAANRAVVVVASDGVAAVPSTCCA